MSEGLLDEKDCQPPSTQTGVRPDGMVDLQTFPNSQFHNNSDGDADGSSISEESYMPENKVHLHGIELL